jgi:hypothetical protein
MNMIEMAAASRRRASLRLLDKEFDARIFRHIRSGEILRPLGLGGVSIIAAGSLAPSIDGARAAKREELPV